MSVFAQLPAGLRNKELPNVPKLTALQELLADFQRLQNEMGDAGNKWNWLSRGGRDEAEQADKAALVGAIRGRGAVSGESAVDKNKRETAEAETKFHAYEAAVLQCADEIAALIRDNKDAWLEIVQADEAKARATHLANIDALEKSSYALAEASAVTTWLKGALKAPYFPMHADLESLRGANREPVTFAKAIDAMRQAMEPRKRPANAMPVPTAPAPRTGQGLNVGGVAVLMPATDEDGDD